MAWINITEDDVRRSLTDAEYSAYTTSFLAPGQTSPTPAIIEKVVDYVRGFVAANQKNTLGPAGQIPQKLLDAAVIIVRHRLLNRMRLTINEARTAEYDEAKELMATVAAGKFAIEEPITPSAEKQNQGVAVPGPRLPPKDRRWSRAKQDGV